MLLVCSIASLRTQAQGTAFTYQGRLNINGSSADGSYDMAFTLYATNVTGTPIAGPVTNTAVAVSNGLFTTTVDFGNVFNGASNWLQIAVSTNGANTFSALSPRQRLTPVPYALYSENAGYASTAGLAAGVVPDGITAGMIAPGAVSVLGTPNGSETNAVVVSTNGLLGIGTGSSTPSAGLQITAGANQTVLPVLYEALNNNGGYTNLGSAFVPAITNNLLAISGNGGITLVSMTNPAAPQLLSQYGGKGSFTNLAGCFGLVWVGSNLVVAAEGSSAVTVISCTNPANPAAISQMVNGVGGWNYLNEPAYLAASGSLVAIPAIGSSAVTLADISNPSAPVLKSTMLNGTFGFTNLGGAVSVSFSGNLLAVGALYSNAVTLVNVADPTSPAKYSEIRNGVNGFTNLNGVISVALSGNLLAIGAAYSSSVTLVNVSNPSNPVKLAELRDGVGGYSLNGAASVAFSNNRLLIGSIGANSITLVDVSNPSNPVLLATAKGGFNGANYLAQPYGLAFDGTNLITCGNSDNSYTVFGVATQAIGLDSSGWVGIGTTQPIAPLDVVGNVAVENANYFNVNAAQVSLGFDAIAGGLEATALGTYADATGTNSMALGFSTTASGDYSTAVGVYASATGSQSSAVGKNASANGIESCAFGCFAIAGADNACAFGSADAYGVYSFAAGTSAGAYNPFSMALGYEAVAYGNNATAVGYNVGAEGTNSTVLGCQSGAYGLNSTAIGYGATARGSNSWAAGYSANAAHSGAVVLADGSTLFNFSSTNNNEFAVRAVGGVRLVTAIDGSGNPTAGVKLYPGGTAWATISDQNAKKNFNPVDVEGIVEKLAAIPVEKWNYKWESDTNTPNIGPMAQAFKAAFYPGRDDKSITTLEFDGVELAAIQGLNQKLEAQKAENAELKARLEKLEQLVGGKTGGAK